MISKRKESTPNLEKAWLLFHKRINETSVTKGGNKRTPWLIKKEWLIVICLN